MRWEAIKKSWSLARENFPNVKRLYVSIPEKFSFSGSCNIVDLDEPSKKLGEIGYGIVLNDAEPILVLSMGEKKEKVKLAKFTPLEMLVKQSETLPKSALPDELAYLAVSNATLGIKGGKATEDEVHSWLGELSGKTAAVCSEIGRLGFRLAASRRKFKEGNRVRVADPSSNQFNEGGKVLDHKIDKETKNYAYLVQVDGSSEPAWYAERQLEINKVADVSFIPHFESDRGINHMAGLRDYDKRIYLTHGIGETQFLVEYTPLGDGSDRLVGIIVRTYKDGKEVGVGKRFPGGQRDEAIAYADEMSQQTTSAFQEKALQQQKEVMEAPWRNVKYKDAE